MTTNHDSEASRGSQQIEPAGTPERERADRREPTADDNAGEARTEVEDKLPADQPDEGWQPWPEGHREGRSADDDLLRRKG